MERASRVLHRLSTRNRQGARAREPREGIKGRGRSQSIEKCLETCSSWRTCRQPTDAGDRSWGQKSDQRRSRAGERLQTTRSTRCLSRQRLVSSQTTKGVGRDLFARRAARASNASAEDDGSCSGSRPRRHRRRIKLVLCARKPSEAPGDAPTPARRRSFGAARCFGCGGGSWWGPTSPSAPSADCTSCPRRHSGRAPRPRR